ncbi:MAG: penicillin-binding protein [Tunicatimonas sp.]
MNIKNSILLRVRVAFLLALLFTGLLVFRMVQLQLIDGPKWLALAKDVSVQYRSVPAVRGNIYSDNGSLLATSLPHYRVAFDPRVASDDLYNQHVDSLSILLSQHFKNQGAAAYRRKIDQARQKGKRYLLLNSQKIDHLQKKEMETWPLFRAGRYRGGVVFERVNVRYKPFAFLGTRTIGFVNENGRGAGLEYSFDRYLAGTDGQGLFQKMSGNHWKPVYDGTEVRPQEGLDIETTLDVNVQDVAQSSLLAALEEHKAAYGCAVVMEVRTGEIKAMANLSKRKNGRYAEVYNHAVGGLTEPGSTFKLASVMALLEETPLNLSDSIATGSGTYKFYDQTMRDYKTGGFGTITLADAFARSSNIGISQMVNRYFGLKPDRYIEHLKDMGITEPLQLQLAGEGLPDVPTPADPRWSGVTLPWMSIGYGLKLTPLQTLAFYNAVANDGVMVQPLLVKSVKRVNQTVETFRAQVLRDAICSPATLAKVRTLLERVVEEGTASSIRDGYYSIAGKTGTAQKIVDGAYTKQYYTSFAGYFPADAPKYSCIVVIDHPKGVPQYGSDVAAPVFKEIADKIYATDLELHEPLPRQFAREEGVLPVIQAGLRSDLQLICNRLDVSQRTRDETEWTRTEHGGDRVIWTDNHQEKGTVPNVEGMTLRDALYLLENQGLRVEHSGAGRVAKQSKEAGSKAVRGERVKLELG